MGSKLSHHFHLFRLRKPINRGFYLKKYSRKYVTFTFSSVQRPHFACKDTQISQTNNI